jgi:hypothetical protein
MGLRARPEAVARLGIRPRPGDGTHHHELTALRRALEARAGELAGFIGAPIEPGRALEAIRLHVGGDEAAAIAWARSDFLGWDTQPTGGAHG